MIEIIRNDIVTNKIELTKSVVKGSWINIVEPTPEEITKISNKLDISENVLRYPLDISEKPHIDIDGDSTLIVIDVPVIEIRNDKKFYTTVPLGLILVRNEYLVTISQVRVGAINEIINSERTLDINTAKQSRLIFQILYTVAFDFIRYIDYISKDIDSFEKDMKHAVKNDKLVSLLDFEKTMIYFNASLKSNQAVLQKMARGTHINLYEEDHELLEDIIIENRQAIEMIQTYSDILNGIIDIFGTIVSNNLNQIMKFLTSITIIISIPTMIFSFLGMNVKFPFSTNVEGFYGVVSVCILSIIITVISFKKKNML